MRHTDNFRDVFFNTVGMIAQSAHARAVLPLKNRGGFFIIALGVESVFGRQIVERLVLVDPMIGHDRRIGFGKISNILSFHFSAVVELLQKSVPVHEHGIAVIFAFEQKLLPSA